MRYCFGLVTLLLTVCGCSQTESPVGSRVATGNDAAMSEWDSGSGALANSFRQTMVSSITGRTYEVSVALPYGYDESAA